ncbi:uncharacterized protein BDR25DRAFT_319685 [Lindgomyces ingoldianus]|uniref:Uncharacterized protein n=1 Tax=Lindgomyces ingoldianus TaxID=673940 RepID=A0ACB6Q9S2_9PLEO|nr:uncharacterized protein BDR25DRAFT_319685 [Lindgomyces ingoldianus]KAF2463784.1 hypothetical protein BDR25DRAFT_319685 [Lindgomyces ingoldianus]
MQHLAPSNHPWSNVDLKGGPPSSRNTDTHDDKPASVDPWTLYEDESYRHFFRRYQAKEIMRGHELAQDQDLFQIVSKYTEADLRLLLIFMEDGSLEFFKKLRMFWGSQILEWRESIVTSSAPTTKSRSSTSVRDSGYESCLSDEMDGSARLSTGSCGSTGHLQLNYGSPSTSSALTEQPSPLTCSFASSFPSDSGIEQRRERALEDFMVVRSSQDLSNESADSSPMETTTKLSRPRLFECMYCAQDFVRSGDCLNHEENNHSQRKEWICPHCQIRSKTKAGHDRHHRNHHCQPCAEPERVEILSDPKTACACPYCSTLFEGIGCFALRANHIKLTHYKVEPRKTKEDLDHSRMIRILLRREGFSGQWENFLAGQAKVPMGWKAEHARELVDELEFGDYPKSGQIQRIYDLADKRTLPFKSLSSMAYSPGRLREPEGRSITPVNISKASEINGGSANNLGNGTNIFEYSEDTMDFVLDRSQAPTPKAPATKISQRTKQILTASISDEGQYTPSLLNSVATSRVKSRDEQLSPQLPFSLRGDVFMGSRRDASEFHDTMPLSRRNATIDLSPAPRNPTPPSYSWNWSQLDDPLMRMEDMMTHQILTSTQALSNTPTYTSPAWEDALPPSLRATTANSPPPAAPLPWHPQRHSPKGPVSRH